MEFVQNDCLIANRHLAFVMFLEVEVSGFALHHNHFQ